jgi:hypothetical protein
MDASGDCHMGMYLKEGLSTDLVIATSTGTCTLDTSECTCACGNHQIRPQSLPYVHVLLATTKSLHSPFLIVLALVAIIKFVHSPVLLHMCL